MYKRQGKGALRGARRVDNLIGQGKIGVVEDVEELRAELQAGALAELGGLKQREVPVGEAGAYEAVARRVADGPISRSGEGAGVEVLRDLLGRTSVGVESAAEGWVDVGAYGVCLLYTSCCTR